MTGFTFFAAIFAVRIAIQLIIKYYPGRDEAGGVDNEPVTIEEDDVRRFPQRPTLGDVSDKM